jgi:hypothetical protein
MKKCQPFLFVPLNAVYAMLLDTVNVRKVSRPLTHAHTQEECGKTK